MTIIIFFFIVLVTIVEKTKPNRTNMDSFLLIFLILIAYVVLLFVMKFMGVGEKETSETCLNSCPDCKCAMERIKRLGGDYLLNHLTFHIFTYKRYRCMDCGWEGLRWERGIRPGKR